MIAIGTALLTLTTAGLAGLAPVGEIGEIDEPGAPRAAAAIDPSDFRRWFDLAARGKLRFPAETRRNAETYKYVFVGGFLGEDSGGYFAQNVEALRDLGVPEDSIRIVQPSSAESLAGNRDAVSAAIHEVAVIDGPLVLIGHSRGACDALAFALEEPEFVRDRVAAIFLVQGPFGGTGVVDYVYGEGEAMDRRIPARARLMGGLIAARFRSQAEAGPGAGLEGLGRDASKTYWEDALADHEDAVRIIDPKVYYITARVAPARQRFFRKPPARYLTAYYGPNDGFVAVEDQSLPGLGRSLGILDVGHTDLTHKFPAARAKPKLRKALARSIAMAVGGGQVESEAKSGSSEE